MKTQKGRKRLARKEKCTLRGGGHHCIATLPFLSLSDVLLSFFDFARHACCSLRNHQDKLITATANGKVQDSSRGALFFLGTRAPANRTVNTSTRMMICTNTRLHVAVQGREGKLIQHARMVENLQRNTQTRTKSSRRVPPTKTTIEFIDIKFFFTSRSDSSHAFGILCVKIVGAILV